MKRITVGICDDEIIILRMLKEIVSGILIRKGIDTNIGVYQSGSNMLSKAHLFDLVFLDIEMPEIDGIKLGKEIQKINRNCKIIMATRRIDRYKDAFKISAVRFITKPFDIDEINEAIEYVLRTNIGLEPLDFYHNRIKHFILQREIRYVTAYDSYIECKAGTNIYRKETSLNKMEELLDERIFYRVNKQYIVNFIWIKEYIDGIIYIDEIEILISRRKRTVFEKAYIEYDINSR